MTSAEHTDKEEILAEIHRQPLQRVTIFPVEAAIWRNRTKDGKAYYAVTFDRMYRDPTGQWKRTSRFTAEDLLVLAKIADIAHSQITEFRTADRHASERRAPCRPTRHIRYTIVRYRRG